ncbi:MAG: von Willebrand factor type A domain-containing protein [Clostridia bacterium]|nr:von Willebrand factor type A domain-containing protein [Clostridia bacterium]
MKKRIISLLLTLIVLLSLVSCGAEGGDMWQEGVWDKNEALAPGETPDGILEEDPTGDGHIDPTDPHYGKFMENKFVNTAEENVSTFAADVDTASFAYFRKLVEQGYSFKELKATAGGSIRTEEMINYFDYGYKNPADGELFSTAMQIAPCPWNEEAKLLILGLQAKKLETAAKNNLVFLIDVSGSMGSADKLELLKKAFTHLTDKLGEDDVVSIVTYSGEERVVLEGCSGAKKDMIINAVNALTANGVTNGEAGLVKAYQIAEKYYINDGNNRIIMASDGDLNVGISSPEELEEFVEEKKKSGVFLSVLGFGTGNYKDAKMETIADRGNGVYYYIDGETEAEKVFGEDIFSTLYTVAKDVKLQLTFNTETISAYRLVGYENRLLDKEDFLDDTKDAGELGAGHSLTVCYEIVLTERAMDTDEWMTLGVRYKAPDGDKSEGREYAFGKAHYTETPSPAFRFITAVAETSMLLHDSNYTKDISLEDVKATLDSLDLDGDFYKAQFASLVDTLIKNGNNIQ